MKTYTITEIISTTEADSIEVELMINYSIENNGIGAYEYWGAKCFDRGHNFAVVECVEWNEDLYSKEENEAIRLYTEDENWQDRVAEIINDKCEIR